MREILFTKAETLRDNTITLACKNSQEALRMLAEATMDNQIAEDPYRTLARERCHEDARQTVATNRMLVQSLVIINGGAAIAALAYYGAHNASGPVSWRLFRRLFFIVSGFLLPHSLVSTSGEQLKNGQAFGSLTRTRKRPSGKE
jgi:hypothetical protein